MKRNDLKRMLKSRWTVLSLIAVVILLSGVIYTYTRQTRTKETTVETSTLDTGDIILSATGVGTLISNQEVSFGFTNKGQVSEVLVSLGEQVKAGQVLARLENRTLTLKYQQAKATLEALNSPSGIATAEQAVEDAKQSLATARDDWQQLIGPEMMVGEEEVMNAQDELLTAQNAAAKDPSEANKQKVSEAQAALTRAQETLNYAFYNYSNSYTLKTFTFPIRNDKGTTIRRQFIPPTDAELLAGRSAYELARANLKDARNYLDVLKGNKTADEVPASSVTAITEAKNALDSAAAALHATELTAPINGTITMLNLNDGEDVDASAVVTISDMNQPYMFDVYLDETDWDKAKVGYTASVTFDLLPSKSFPGKITQVYPALDDASGSSMVHILVQLDSKIDADLPAGVTASVDVTGGKALGVVLVPTSALKEVETGKYIVYLIQNGKPVEQSVEIGLQDILYAEAKSGLKAGDVVLTDAATVNP